MAHVGHDGGWQAGADGRLLLMNKKLIAYWTLLLCLAAPGSYVIAFIAQSFVWGAYKWGFLASLLSAALVNGFLLWVFAYALDRLLFPE